VKLSETVQVENETGREKVIADRCAVPPSPLFNVRIGSIRFGSLVICSGAEEICEERKMSLNDSECR
jgi:hypothetical protein